MANNVELLAELNSFRIAEGLEPYADWRKARHMNQLDEARKILANRKAAEFEASEAELAAQTLRPVAEVEDATTEEAAPVVTPEPVAAPEKMKSYKQVANYEKSSKESPVAFIHAFLSANPTLSRKAAVIALTSEHGINYSTARTQYQRWFTANKAAK